MRDDQIHNDQAHPLYEWTQVITHEELHMMVNEMAVVYAQTSWRHWKDKLKLAGGLATVSMLLIWLHNGKPQNANFIANQKGDQDNAEHN